MAVSPTQEHFEEPRVPQASPDAGLVGRAGRSAGQGVRGAQRPRQPQPQKQPAAAPFHCDVTHALVEGSSLGWGEEGFEEARPPGERLLLVAGKSRLFKLLFELSKQQQVASKFKRQGGEDASQLGAAADTQFGEASGAY